MQQRKFHLTTLASALLMANISYAAEPTTCTVLDTTNFSFTQCNHGGEYTINQSSKSNKYYTILSTADNNNSFTTGQDMTLNIKNIQNFTQFQPMNLGSSTKDERTTRTFNINLEQTNMKGGMKIETAQKAKQDNKKLDNTYSGETHVNIKLDKQSSFDGAITFTNKSIDEDTHKHNNSKLNVALKDHSRFTVTNIQNEQDVYKNFPQSTAKNTITDTNSTNALSFKLEEESMLEFKKLALQSGETMDINATGKSHVKGNLTGDNIQVVLNDSTFEGRINPSSSSPTQPRALALTLATNETPAPISGRSITLQGNSTWKVEGDSSLSNLEIQKGTIDISNSSITTDTLKTENGHLVLDASKTHTLEVTGKAEGNIAVRNMGTLDLKDIQTPLITVGEGSTIKATGSTEGGLYQYDLTLNNGTFAFTKNTQTASNAGSVIQAITVAPINIANLQTNALSTRQDHSRLSKNDNGGVWVQYLGSKQKHTTSGHASYNIHINGVMFGGDTRIQTTDGSWLLGLAASSAKGNFSTLQSGGNTKGYSLHAYLSRQYNNGIFFDTTLQFGHYGNKANVIIANDGGKTQAHFDSNGFGASFKGGYTWENMGFFVQPYAQLSLFTLDGVQYQFDKINVKTDSYNSILGNIGTRLGYDFTLGNTSVKPYLNLAAVKEFVSGNKVSLGKESINTSIDVAAFQVGTGVQVDISKNLGLYASFDYLKGKNTETPLKGTVGMNITW